MTTANSSGLPDPVIHRLSALSQYQFVPFDHLRGKVDLNYVVINPFSKDSADSVIMD